MARLEEDINPEILGWARERAGLSLEKAAKKIGLSSQKLAKMENGESKPTRTQLSNIAKAYWRPVTVFYADEPPVESYLGADFRSTGLEISAEERGRLDALIRNIHVRQSIVKGILEEDEESRSFVGSLKDTDNTHAAVEVIKKILTLPDDRALDFTELRERVHGIGVFVLLIGDLGSYHTKIPETTFRGLAIADRIAPFIVINPYDAKAARSFTLIHELTHVMMDRSGISGEVDIDNSEVEHRRIEKFCNDVASHILLPQRFLSGIKTIDDVEKARSIIQRLTQNYKVSHSMVAYRLYRENLIKKEMYKSLYQFYQKNWKKKKEQEKKESGGPSFYVVRKQRIGKLLVNLVERSLNTNELTYTKAARVLGVKALSVRVLIES